VRASLFCLPAGAEVAVLEGDPKGEGLFTMRVRLPAGSKLAPHWHPRPERVTVLSGSIGIGYGEVFEPAKLRLFRAGSYYMTPPEVRHFGACFEETVVQITTHGPWQLHAVVPTLEKSP
jgi:quercetin dioxygenase-like cupin family protein